MSDTPAQAVLEALDALDLEALTGQMTQDVSLMLPYGLDAAGLQASGMALKGFFSELRSTSHEIRALWNPEPTVWIAEMSATYELSDFSRRGPYPRVMILQTNPDGEIVSLHFYGGHELPLSESDHPYRDVRGPHGWLPTL